MLYADLVIATGDLLNRGDLFAAIPTFIAMAEAKMNRRLRVQKMVITASSVITAEYEQTPGDMLGPISISINPSSSGTYPYTLRNVSPDAINEDLGLMAGINGQPKKYAVVGTAFHFSPIPDAAYTAYLTYFQQLAALSNTNTSNWLLASHPDAYLYGTLSQAGLYAETVMRKPDPRTGAWAALFEAAMQEIEAADRGDAFGAHLETPSRVANLV